jgi:primosomal protein N' (replication factor Y)
LRGRGSARFTEEIGRAFPGFPVITSELGSIHESIPARPSLVIATPGCVPTVESGYGAVVILEALSLLTQLDLRAQERAREQIYSAAAKVSTQGGVGFVLEADNPVIGSVARWSPAILSQAELRERMEGALPPFARSAVIETASSKVIQILNGFRRAQEDGRIPPGVRVLGPSTSKPGRSKIVFLVELSQSAELFQFLHEYQRRLSMSKKPLDMLRIDPYSLS